MGDSDGKSLCRGKGGSVGVVPTLLTVDEEQFDWGEIVQFKSKHLLISFFWYDYVRSGTFQD